jgi:hypothetical protein
MSVAAGTEERNTCDAVLAAVLGNHHRPGKKGVRQIENVESG